MHAPQIIMAAILVYNLLSSAYDFEKTRNRTEFMGSIVGFIIIVGLLWWGGFWTG